MADTNRGRLYLAEETGDWADPPTGEYNELRITGESLSEDKDTVTSDEIRSDRQVADVKEVQVRADGSIDYELTFNTFNDVFEGVLLNRWDSKIDLTLASVDVTNQDTYDADAGDFDAVEEGQWILVGGFSDEDNNGFRRIAEVAGDGSSITVQYATLVNTTGESDITFEGERIVNGTDNIHFTIEKEFEDVGEFYRYPGAYFEGITTNIEPGSLIDGSLDVLAQQEEHRESQTASSVNAAPDTPTISATADVDEIREAGSTDITVASLNFDYSNSLRERPAVGQKTTQEPGLGRIAATGSLEAFFESPDLYNRYLDQDESDISYRTTDDEGNTLIITFGNLKYVDGEKVLTGVDEDVFASLDFEAYRVPDDKVGSSTIQIDRFAA